MKGCLVLWIQKLKILADAFRIEHYLQYLRGASDPFYLGRHHGPTKELSFFVAAHPSRSYRGPRIATPLRLTETKRVDSCCC